MKRIVLALVAMTGVAHAQPDAESLYKEGQAAYDARNYDAALAAWTKSYELSKLPALLFNIAQAHRLRGDCREAVDRYQQFIAADPQASERGDAEGFIRDLEPRCPKPAVKQIDPVVRPDIVKRVEPRPITGNPGRGKRIAAYVIGGGGLAVLGVGVAFGAIAKDAADNVNTACNPECSWDLVKDKDAQGRAAERNQYIAYGIGGAAVLTAGVLYFLGARDREQAVTVTPRGDGATISWTGRW